MGSARRVGTDDGEGHAARAQPWAAASEKAPHGVLGGAVEGDAGDRREAGERGDVDDVAAAARDHVAGSDAGAVDDALRVDIEVTIDLESGSASRQYPGLR